MSQPTSAAAPTNEKKPQDLRRKLPVLVLVVAALLAISAAVWMVAPPAVVPASAPSDQFSAERAEEYLRLLVGDDLPHPAGSDQNRVVRQRLVEALEQMGFAVELQETSHPLRFRRQETDPENVPLTNIMARIEGNDHDHSVMLVAHHDSVPYGPGASDDAAAVAAVLEIARMLRDRDATPQRDIIFLITDGEEFGLLGARRFVEEHPWTKQVKWVINLEARGTSGPSCMFETNENNIDLIRTFARHVERPVSSSLFYDIYRSMPNDTDFTIFKRAGMRGFNFAFIGHVQNYHTPNDDLEHLSRRSLQHHGDNALALVRALAYQDEWPTSTGNAVWFDLFGRQLIWWPTHWGWGVVIAVIVIILVHARKTAQKYRGSTSGVARQLASPILALLTIAAIAIAYEWLQRTQGLIESPWPESGLRKVASIWMLGMAVATVMAMVSRGRKGEEDHASLRALGYWAIWTAMATLVLYFLPGGSYLWLAPMACLIVGWGIDRVARNELPIGAATAFAAANVLLWIPIEPLFYDAVGFRFPGILGLRVGLALFPIALVLQWVSPMVRYVLAGLGLAGAILLALV